jgi:hypothetical protein
MNHHEFMQNKEAHNISLTTRGEWYHIIKTISSVLAFHIFQFPATETVSHHHVLRCNEYDLVILNGRVMDPETMFDNVANVGEWTPVVCNNVLMKN